MKRLVLFIALLLSSFAQGSDTFKYSLGIGLGEAALLGGQPPWFTLSPTYNVRIAANLETNWQLEFGILYCKIYNDSSVHSNFHLGSSKNSRRRAFQATDYVILFKYYFHPIWDRIRFIGGAGGGISAWKFTDPGNGLIIKTTGQYGETVDFSATEIILEPVLGIDCQLNPKWQIGLEGRASYLTGAGAEFAESVEDARPPWKLGMIVTLNYLFGEGKSDRRADREESANIPSRPKERPPIVPKTAQMSALRPETAFNKIDKNGGPVISLGEKSPCGDEASARGKIDLHGCPIDSDCDGLSDFLDKCPDNAVGASVDKSGCPIDSDRDGVPDGLDDCPGTDPGLPVDSSGCIDLGFFDKPVVLRIRYRPGDFELNPPAAARLDTLGQILQKALLIKVEINGYCNDQESPSDNKFLSEKRANRIRDYLKVEGVEGDRLTSVGHGNEELPPDAQDYNCIVLKFKK